MVFDPLKSLSPDIKVVENALIVPYGQGNARGVARYAGIYDQSGSYIAEGQCFRNSVTPTTIEPQEQSQNDPEAYIKGTWIWGGLLYGHFGHMLLESTSRLWVHDHVEAEGELFLLKKKVTWPNRFLKPLTPVLAQLGAKVAKTKGIVEPIRVEQLIVAPQGFGTGDMVAGCPEMRAFVKSSWGQSIVPKGHDKIYISRSRLYSKRGRYIGEELVERLLQDEGYAIFHAQDHSVEEQIAQYKAARIVISSDSSALHLHAPFANNATKVAIILRRPGDTIGDYLTQYRYFADLKPDVLSALTGKMYQFDGARNAQMSEVYTEIDISTIGKNLLSLGYINDSSRWCNLSGEMVESEVSNLSERLGVSISVSPAMT